MIRSTTPTALAPSPTRPATTPTTVALALTTLAFLLPAAARADDAGAELVELFRRGDPVPGSQHGAFREALSLEFHDGQSWTMHFGTGQFAALVAIDGAVVVGPVTGVEGGVDVNTSGQMATAGSGLFRDGVPIVETGDPATAPGFTPGSTYSGFYNVRIDEAGNVAGTTVFIEPGTIEPQQALLRFTLDGAGNVLDEELVMRSGDPVDGSTVLSIWCAAIYGSESLAMSADGELLYTLLLEDWPFFVPRVNADDAVYLKHGQSSPAGPLNIFAYRPLLTYTDDDVPAARVQWVTQTDYGDVIVVGQDEIIVNTADPHPVDTTATLKRLGAPRFDAEGNVLWYGQLDDGSGGLFLNDLLLVEEGVTRVDGDLVLTPDWDWADIRQTDGAYDISDDGEVVIARLVVENPGGGQATEQAIVRIDVGPWVSVGHGLPGTGGLRPSLYGSGPLTGGSTAKLRLTSTLPGATTYLVLGASRIDAPFKGGVLVPSVNVLIPGLPVDGDGKLAIDFAFPAGLPSGAELFWQFWTHDPGAVFGFSASNGMRATVP